MQPLLKPPGGDKTWSALALLASGIVSLTMVALGRSPSPAAAGLSGAWFLLAGYGVWRNRLWGYWLGILATAFVCLKLAFALISDPFLWSRLIFCLSFGWFTVALYMERPRARSDRPMISLVLLLGSPRSMTAYSLAQQVSTAWGVPVNTVRQGEDKSSATEDKSTYVLGETPLFMIGHQEELYLVNNFERPYFDDPAKAAEACPELRLQKILKEHQAWLSVDLLQVGEKPDRAHAYKQIARLIAELAGDDCLAVYCPENGHLNSFDPSLIAGLKGENPLEVFQQITQLPVIQIADDDPELEAAVAEARRRWPEFVAAFNTRQPDHHFAVKAPVTRKDNTEFIWLTVDRLDDTTIHGRLDNDPVNLGQLKHGDSVSVPVSDLNDWVYARGEDINGMFTSKILLKKQK